MLVVLNTIGEAGDSHVLSPPPRHRFAEISTSSRERKRLSDLTVGESVLASDGDLNFSPVLLFLDRNPDKWRRFVKIRTESGHTLTVTPSHLLNTPKGQFTLNMPKFPEKMSNEDIAAMEGEGQCNKKTLETRNRIMNSFINFGIAQDDPVDVLEQIKMAEAGNIGPLEDTLKQFFAEVRVGPKNELPKKNTIDSYRYTTLLN